MHTLLLNDTKKACNSCDDPTVIIKLCPTVARGSNFSSQAQRSGSNAAEI